VKFSIPESHGFLLAPSPAETVAPIPSRLPDEHLLESPWIVPVPDVACRKEDAANG